MDIFVAILFLIIGFVMLSKGADWFVDGAAGLAKKLGIPTLIVGLTIVSFGTTAPELSTSIISAVKKDVGIAIGNVVGSNITNILLILGLGALFCAIPAKKQSRTTALPVLLAASVLLLVFGIFGLHGKDYTLQRYEGAILFGGLIAFDAFLVWQALKERKKQGTVYEMNDEEDENGSLKGFNKWYEEMKAHTWFLGVAMLVGLGVVVGGAMLAVDGAKTIAEAIGVSQKVIGLTVVAIGTSLPELITCTTAARKGETDIAIGNIVGACTINILLVVGMSSIITPLPFGWDGSYFTLDTCIAIGAAALLAILCYMPGYKIRRWGGITLLAGFAAYYVYLFAFA